MRVNTTLALAFAAGANAVIQADADLSNPENGKILPGAYIAEFEAGLVRKKSKPFSRSRKVLTCSTGECRRLLFQLVIQRN